MIVKVFPRHLNGTCYAKEKCCHCWEQRYGVLIVEKHNEIGSHWIDCTSGSHLLRQLVFEPSLSTHQPEVFSYNMRFVMSRSDMNDF